MPSWSRSSAIFASFAMILVACGQATPGSGVAGNISTEAVPPATSAATASSTIPPPTVAPKATLSLPVSRGTLLPVPTKRLTPGEPLTLLAEWNPGSAVNSLDFSPVGGMLASSHTQFEVALWDIASRGKLSEFEHASPRVMNIAFSPDGSQLASIAAGEKKAYVWDVASASLLRTFESYGKNLYSLTFSPDGARLATGFADRTVVWNIASGAKEQTILGGNVIWLDYSPDGKVLAVASIPSLDISRYGKPLPFVPPEKRGSGYVTSSAAHYYMGGFYLWDLEAPSSTVESGEGAIFAGFTPDGAKIVSVGYDNEVHILDIPSGERRTFQVGFRDYSYLAAAISPDGSYLALGGGANDSDDGFLARLNLADGDFPGFGYGRLFNQGAMKGVTSLAISPDGMYLATGESDGTICLWGTWK